VISRWRSFALDDQADRVDDDQVRGIIDVEKVFHFQPSALTAVEGERKEREERHPLIAAVDEAEPREGDRGNEELRKLSRRGEDEHGHEHAPDPVVNAKIRIRQQGEHLDQEEYSEKGEGEEKPCIEPSPFHGVVPCVDQDDGEGERDQNALIERIHGEKVDELTKQPQTEHLQEIFQPVFRVFCALRNHIGKDGERQPAEYAQDRILREDLKPDVIERHRDQGEELQLISRETLEKFRFHAVFSFLRRFDWFLKTARQTGGSVEIFFAFISV